MTARLPIGTRAGAVFGGLFVLAGILTWTATRQPLAVWAVLGVEGVVFAGWGRPWLARLRALPRLGAAWLGLAYWLSGIAGAVLSGHLTVAAQRLAYAGVFTLAALAVVAAVSRRSNPAVGTDPTVGIALAMLVGVGALLLAGSGTLFSSVHEVPPGTSSHLMRYRFWGGLGLFYHPNSLAGLAVAAAVRVGADRAFAAWQRLAVVGLTGFVLVLTDSRIAFVFAVAAAVVHGVLVLRQPGRRRHWPAVAVPFAVLAVVLILSGGQAFLIKDRFGADRDAAGVGDVTSGRTDTWRQVALDWEHAGWAEKVFGDARTSRAVVTRLNDGEPPQGPRRQLNTDNAAVGAFRRGGIPGELAFLGGLGLLVWHAVRRRGAAQWFAIAAVAAVPTIATEDWLLGGTNGAIWLLLLSGEALAVRAGPSTTGQGVGDLVAFAQRPAGRDIGGAGVQRLDAEDGVDVGPPDRRQVGL